MFKALLLKQRNGSSCRHRSKFYSINPQIAPWSNFASSPMFLYLSCYSRGQSFTHLIQTQWVRGKEAKYVGNIKCREPVNAFQLTRKEQWGCASLTGSHKHPAASELWLVIAHYPAQQPDPSWVLALEILSFSQPMVLSELLVFTFSARRSSVCVLMYLLMLPFSYSGHSFCLRSPSARRCTHTVTWARWGWSEGLLLHHGFLTLQCLNHGCCQCHFRGLQWGSVCSTQWVILWGLTPSVHSDGKQVSAQCHRYCEKLQMHAEEQWEVLGPSRLTQIKDSFV